MIPINKTGRVINEPAAGKFVMILDDEERTGGYLVLMADNPEFRPCFDDWIQKYQLQEYMDARGWQIEWLDINS
jgi:hypothetical protein